MCLAIPGLVVEVGAESAVVEIDGERSRVSLNLLSEEDRPAVGDYLVCHLGMALQRIDEAEAKELLEMIREVAGWAADLEDPALQGSAR